MTVEQEARDMLVRMGFPSAAYASSGTLIELANLINNSKRFEVDVAYMPVPRCDSCAHWSGGSHSDGVCAKVIQLNGMLVPKDFGCVQWKEKP